MHLQRSTQLLTKRLMVSLTLILISQLASIVTSAQSLKHNSVRAPISTPEKTDRVTSAIVFETEAIIVRRITVGPNSTGYHYRHPGGSIVLLSEYSYPISIPLSEDLKGELKVGDAIHVPSGDYVLENPTTKPLDFLSIEMKH